MMSYFSKTEQEILDVIGKRKLTIKEITDKHFGTDQPLEAGNRIAGVVRRIKRKCEYYEDIGWTIRDESEGKEKLVWVEKK